MYDNLSQFFAGEGIPSNYHEYFEEYDPSKEEILDDQFALDSRTARFELNKQKRALLGQSAKMGFAAHGQHDAESANLMDIFGDTQNLAALTYEEDVKDVKNSWLQSQYDILATIQDDIDADNMTAPELAGEINQRDDHWEMKNLDNYYGTDKERMFLRYSYNSGAGGMDTW